DAHAGAIARSADLGSDVFAADLLGLLHLLRQRARGVVGARQLALEPCLALHLLRARLSQLARRSRFPSSRFVDDVAHAQRLRAAIAIEQPTLIRIYERGFCEFLF